VLPGIGRARQNHAVIVPGWGDVRLTPSGCFPDGLGPVAWQPVSGSAEHPRRQERPDDCTRMAWIWQLRRASRRRRAIIRCREPGRPSPLALGGH